MTEPTISVVIITFKRPEVVRTNLEHLAAQEVPAHQVIVVDSSPDDQTRDGVAGFTAVTFV